TGRLVLKLREQEGLTYQAFSGFTADTFPGFWAAESVVRNEMLAPALEELFSQLKRIREEPVGSEELRENRRAIIARLALSADNSDELLDHWLTVWHYGLPPNYWDLYTRNIAAVDEKAVLSAARKYIDLDHMQIVCVGDAARIKEKLDKFGPVNIYNSAGLPVSYSPGGKSSVNPDR
ncbi:MAG TPA: insulinase family protein, partial [Candidatus Angelobacter sp.]|nr:insulinase family protein [Candidatus Angelobacter sp.]